MSKVNNIGSFYPKRLSLCYARSIDNISPYLPFTATFEEVLSLYWKVKKWQIHTTGRRTVGDADIITYNWDRLTTSIPPNSEKKLVCGENILGWELSDGSPNTSEDSLWVTASEWEIASIPFFGATSEFVSAATYRLPFYDAVGTTTLNVNSNSWTWDCYGDRGDRFVYVHYANISITAVEFWNY